MVTHTKNLIFPPDAILTLEMVLKNGLEKKCINHKLKEQLFQKTTYQKKCKRSCKECERAENVSF